MITTLFNFKWDDPLKTHKDTFLLSCDKVNNHTNKNTPCLFNDDLATQNGSHQLNEASRMCDLTDRRTDDFPSRFTPT